MGGSGLEVRVNWMDQGNWDRLHEPAVYAALAQSPLIKERNERLMPLLTVGGSSLQILTGAVQLAAQSLRSALARCDAGLQVSTSQGGRSDVPVWLTGGRYTVSVKPVGVAVPRKRMVVQVELSDAEQWRGSLPVSFDVACRVNQLYLANNVNRHAALRPEDVTRAALDVTDLPVDTAKRLMVDVPVGPVRLARAKREGDILLTTDVEPMPLVFRNGWALLQTTVGAVSLATKVRVGQDGVLGQVVHVKPTLSTVSVWATVMGPNFLEIK